ncbi:glycosyltransferase family 4 protein [Falsiroseomonas sp. HW251]|uniref:glycosyltransferase family 4 protein n=1 Tax=Falsiroseomonas sp. HW251 TaxID=3390998 RepID=UPI003D310194
MSPPRLTIDVTPLLEAQWTGIPVFTRRLVRALGAAGVELDHAVRLSRVPADAVERAMRLGNGNFLRLLQERPPTEATPIDPGRPLLYPSVKPIGGIARREASTIHDLSTLVMPETHSPANVAHHLDPLRETLLTDETVFCCSEATRSAVVQTWPWVEPKTRLLMQYADWPDGFELMERNLPQVAIGRYAVVIGTVEARKNLGLLLRALKEPALERSGLRFVVIGRRGHGAEQLLARLSPAAQERVTFTGYVSEFVKYRLLKHAEFLVLPSVYEGFGIPAVEAMSLGKPVLAAMTSSFPEVIGQAGVFFDPFSVAEFAAALEEIADPRRLAELAPRAIVQAASFGPERMAAPVLEWLRG